MLISYFSIMYISGDDMYQNLKTRSDIIEFLNDEESAVESGPNSALGKRRAYECLVFQQRGSYSNQCFVTLYSLLTSYSISSSKVAKLLCPPLLKLNSDGIILYSAASRKFMIQDYVYTRLRKDCVVNLCPYVPLNSKDERSCYCTLLIHIPWPIGGEEDILRGYNSAVQCLMILQSNDEIPSYVEYILNLFHTSDSLRENVGIIQNRSEIDDDELMYSNSADENNFSTQRDDYIDQVSEQLPIFIANNSNNIGILSNISRGNKQFFMDFIRNEQNNYLHRLSSENSSSAILDDANIPEGNDHINIVNNRSERLLALELNVQKLTSQQLKAYNIAVDYISGNKGSQMMMFVTGEGGTGKSFLISLIMEYTQIRHGKQGGLYGSALAIAPTGAAANVIKGYTWQSVYGKGRSKKKDSVMSSKCAQAVGSKVLGVKLIVLDEISMINLEDLNDISERQIAAMGTSTSDENVRRTYQSQHFGGVHMLFTGDFYQLKPIRAEAIYTRDVKYERSRKGYEIWNSINEYVVLTENTRYKNDTSPIMNNFLSGARTGHVDVNLIHHINARVQLSEDSARTNAGPDAVWIAHENKIVKKFNDYDFNDKVKSGARHFRLVAKYSSDKFYTKKPNEDTLKSLITISRNGCAPPYIDLAIGSRVSCTKNLATQIGELFGDIYWYYSMI